jgi:hypothetical protein
MVKYPRIKEKNGRPDESGLFGVMSVGIFLNHYMNCYNYKNWHGVDAMQSASFNLIKRAYLQKLVCKGINSIRIRNKEILYSKKTAL